MKPKMFLSEKELVDCAIEWKKRLFLSDWNIMIGFADELMLDGACCGGISEIQYENSCGTITILSERSLKNADIMEKHPHELITIHELLHFIYPIYEKQNQGIEQEDFNIKQHQQIERMAKSLYMAKYNLEYSWFRQEVQMERCQS